MIAKIKAIKLLSLTVAALVICTGLLTFYPPGKQAGSGSGSRDMQEAIYEITNVPVSEVAALAVTNSKARFGLLIKGEELELVSDVQGDYSLTELRSLIYAAAHLTGSRKITDLTNAEQYGMNQPSASISLIKTDGTQLDLSLLSQNSMDGNYYLHSKTDQAIYLIPANVAELFLRQEKDFFNHTVLPVIKASDLQSLEWLQMDFGGAEQDYRVEANNGSFSMSAPVRQKLTTLSVMQKLIIPLSALYSDEFVAAGADPAEYGFSNYTLRVEMMYGGQQYAALLLDTGDGTCLMADEKTGDIYALGAESLMPLMSDYRELFDGKAFSYAAGDLKSVEISEGENHILVELSGEKGEAAPELKLLSALNDVEIAAELQGGVKNEGGADTEPVLTLTYTMQSGSIDVIEFSPAPQGGYYVSVNNTVNFITTERYIQAAIKAAADYN